MLLLESIKLTLIFVKMYKQNAFFIAPELPAWKKVLSSKTFSDKLSISAIDEAHCIVEWSVVTCRVHVHLCVNNNFEWYNGVVEVTEK